MSQAKKFLEGKISINKYLEGIEKGEGGEKLSKDLANEIREDGRTTFAVNFRIDRRRPWRITLDSRASTDEDVWLRHLNVIDEKLKENGFEKLLDNEPSLKGSAEKYFSDQWEVIVEPHKDSSSPFIDISISKRS